MTTGDDDDNEDEQHQQQQRLQCSNVGRLHGHTHRHIHVHASDSGRKSDKNNNNNNNNMEEEKNRGGRCGNGHNASSHLQQQQQLQQHPIHHHPVYYPSPSSSTTTATCLPKEFHIAPMMGGTTREMRQLIRILSKKCVLWTEMIVANTVLHTQHLDQILYFDQDVEHPVVCQLGGCHAEQLSRATNVALSYRYDEINLNCGCPSDRVTGKQEFGAVLMKELEHAESAVQAMVEACTSVTAVATASAAASTDDSATMTPTIPTTTPISIKCRVGVDDRDTLDDLIEFIERLSKHTRIFYLHARKAILGGLMTPHENRTIPPLNYPRVYEICRRFPQCTFYINGGIQTLKAAKELCYGVVVVDIGGSSSSSNNNNHTQPHASVPCSTCQLENGSCIAPPPYPAPSNLRGCMVGRVAMNNPAILWDVDRYFYGDDSNPCATRKEVLDRYCTYLERVYPRRCCDQDPFVTSDLTDKRNFVMEYDYCPLCVDLYYHDERDETDRDDIRTSSITVAPKANHHDDVGIKIKTCTVSRCVKPIQNIFYGARYARLFSREMERQVRNVEVRNCGPAAMIKRALRVMPNEIINRPLVPAEERE